MAGLPHMPLFMGDLLASTAHWTGEERALYLLCLGLEWVANTLPKDPKKLSKMLGYEGHRFSHLWRRVGTKFVESDGGLVNLRLEQHRAKAIEIQRRNAERATRAARGRWDAPSNAPSMGNGMLQASNPDAPSISGEHAIQSNPFKNKNKSARPPVDKSTGRATRTEAQRAFLLLLSSDGRIRPPASQYALERIGGWQALAMRTPFTEDSLRARFCEAYDQCPDKAPQPSPLP